MPLNARDGVKVEVCNTDVVAPDALSLSQRVRICSSQRCLMILGTKQIDGLDARILVRELRKMTLKSRL